MFNPDLEISMQIKLHVKNTKKDTTVDETAKLTVYGDTADAEQLLEDIKSLIRKSNDKNYAQPKLV